MRVGFDQVRLGSNSNGSDGDLARHAANIIAAHSALKVAATMSAKVGFVSTENPNPCEIVAEYGEALKGPLASIISQQILFAAEVLPYEKDAIKSALVKCAKQLSLSDDELSTLGDLHFYLSYFIVGLEERENEPECNLFAEQQSEGLALRSAWQTATASRKTSKFSKLIASWLKPNA